MFMVRATSRDGVREVLLRIRSRFRDRALEWEHAIMMTLWGVTVLLNPGVFNGPSFDAFWGNASVWGWLVFLAGCARITALGINGYMARPTAMVRALAAITGIGLFAAISFGFLFSWTGTTALAMYPVVAVFGLFSLYWSIFDVAIPDEHNA